MWQVNVASRMESSGRIDCTQMSAAAYAAAALPEGTVQKRIVDIKARASRSLRHAH